MKALGGIMITTVGKIFDRTNPDGLSAIESSSFEDAIQADVANDETSYAGALAGTAQVIAGWIAVIMLLLGMGLASSVTMGRKKRRTRRKTTTRKATTRRRTYRKKRK